MLPERLGTPVTFFSMLTDLNKDGVDRLLDVQSIHWNKQYVSALSYYLWVKKLNTHLQLIQLRWVVIAPA